MFQTVSSLTWFFARVALEPRLCSAERDSLIHLSYLICGIGLYPKTAQLSQGPLGKNGPDHIICLYFNVMNTISWGFML